MKSRTSGVVYALGALGIALACAIAAPAIARAAENPDVMLSDMTSLEYTPHYVDAGYLVDNYDNSYGSAVDNYYSNYSKWGFEYLLDGKYSRFVGTLYVPKGETNSKSVTFSIIADGKEIYNSPIMTKTSKPVDVDVSVLGCNDVSLEFSDNYYSRAYDLHVCIASPGFIRVKPSDMDPVNSSGQNIFRMYNPYNGEHLYTTDTNEADSLLSHGWDWEGTSSVPATGSPVYRLCNPYTGEHLYTTSFDEYRQLSGGGWNGEGEKFHSSDSSGKPFYRLYNPWGSGVTAHTYTTDSNEVDTLTRDGWKSDGACWYGIW